MLEIKDGQLKHSSGTLKIDGDIYISIALDSIRNIAISTKTGIHNDKKVYIVDVAGCFKDDKPFEIIETLAAPEDMIETYESLIDKWELYHVIEYGDRIDRLAD